MFIQIFLSNRVFRVRLGSVGVIFDSKLNFKAHIDYIRQTCEKAMNVLKVVAKMGSR